MFLGDYWECLRVIAGNVFGRLLGMFSGDCWECLRAITNRPYSVKIA